MAEIIRDFGGATLTLPQGKVASIAIPEGNVTKIVDSNGNVIWEGSTLVLQTAIVQSFDTDESLPADISESSGMSENYELTGSRLNLLPTGDISVINNTATTSSALYIVQEYDFDTSQSAITSITSHVTATGSYDSSTKAYTLNILYPEFESSTGSIAHMNLVYVKVYGPTANGTDLLATITVSG